MTQGVSLISSGFSLIDKKWGGIYRGGSYLIIGPRKSGRTLLSLQFALETAKANEVCLYFTNMRPKDLMIQAASLNFDIQSYMNQNLLIVVRIAPPNEIYEVPNPDDYLIEYLNDIITVVNQYNPSRIIFDELTPYIGFRDIDLLKDVFLHTLELIEERNITSLFNVGEPATEKAQQIIDALSDSVTANIYLKKHADKFAGQFHGGTVVIAPNVGHTEGQFSAEYIIEPYKGVSVNVPSLSPIIEKRETNVDYGAQSGDDSEGFVDFQKPMISHKKEEIVFSNIYSYDDFQLILNNQIALYKSTGQSFNLVSFRLDPAAQVKGLLSMNQLKNALSRSILKKDKLCSQDDRIYILVVRSTPQNIAEIMNKLKVNLPSKDVSYLRAIANYIKIYDQVINEEFNNSSEMLELVQSEQGSNAHSPLSDTNW